MFILLSSVDDQFVIHRASEKKPTFSLLKQLLVVFCVLMFLPAPSLLGQSLQQKKGEGQPSEPDQTIALRLMLDQAEQSAYRFVAKGDIGKIRAGTNVLLNIELFNPFDEDINFSEIVMSCACTELTFPDKIFKAKSATVGKLRYHAPLFSRRGQLSLSLSVTDSNSATKTVALVSLTGTLSGVVDIGQNTRTYEVSNAQEEFTFPVYFTDPVTADQLSIRKSDDLRDVVATFDPIGPGEAVVRLQIAKSMVKDSGISGEISIVHERTEKPVAVLVTFTPRLPFRLSPSFLSFREDRVKLGAFYANGILQIRDEVEENQSALLNSSETVTKQPIPAEDHQLAITGSLGVQKVEVKASRMSTGIYRLRFELPNEDDSDNDDSTEGKSQSDVERLIRCVVKYNGQEFLFSVPFFVER